MKKTTKVLAVIMAAMMSLCLFAGCGGSEENKEAVFAKEGYLLVGNDNTYPPMEYVDEKTGATIGFDIDLANAIAKKMGRKAKIVNTAWDSIFAGLDAGKYDVIISSTSITQERLDTLSMSDPYIANQQIIICRKSDKDPVVAVKQLKGKKVGVQVSTTADDACQYYMNKEGIEMDLKQFDGMTEAFVALEGESIDCVVTDLVVGNFYVANQGNKFQVTCKELTNEPIGITAAKNNPGMAVEMNKALEELKKDGTLAKISKKWFGEDLTKDIDTKLKGFEK